MLSFPAVAHHERLITNLIYRYAELLDEGDFASVAALFEHGSITSGPTRHFTGREEVHVGYLEATRRSGDGTRATLHVVNNVVVEVDEEALTASARSCYSVLQQTGEMTLQTIIAGRYRDTFQVIDGTWRFDHREILIDLVGDLSHHLAIDI